MTSNNLPTLVLKRNEERRLVAGHLWVYSNEVDTRKTPLSDFEPGTLAVIQSAVGKTLGSGYVNPHSLICARLLTRRPRTVIDAAFFERRLRSAMQLRDSLFEHSNYRLVYGESDGLPGLVIDRYGDVLVVQITTAGMEAVRELLLEVLNRVLAPGGILLRNDTPVRALEGLSQDPEVIGEVPETVILEEGGVRFEVPLAAGQKTGWYYDHRMNRARLASYARDARVLDLFSYLGGFGVQAAVAGAREVVCVDSSRSALEGVLRNARANGVEARVGTERGDVFEVLKNMAAAGERFDVVVADPPAFARRKRDLKAASEAYQRLHRMAMRVMGEQGILLAASCSSHVDRRTFGDCIRRGARGAARQLLELEVGRQGPDHPVHLAMPETDYLKSSLLLVRG